VTSEIDLLKSYSGRPLRIMEVCGTHTAAIFRSGIREILSQKIKLISGPGCPVCVTPTAYIDKCISFAMKPDQVLCSFGDMLKVPGSSLSLSLAQAAGAHIKMMYSPFDVIGLAKAEPQTEFTIAAVGFETTAPAYSLLLDELRSEGIRNVRLLTAIKSALSAIEWIAAGEDSIDAFLCPGHVSVITGSEAYRDIAEKYKKPFVIAGFEPEHLIKAICEIVRMADENEDISVIARNSAESRYLGNLYKEAVNEKGNTRAIEKIDEYFSVGETVWRGLGSLPESAYYLKDEFACFDAGSRDLVLSDDMPEACCCPEVITGRIDPPDCPLFGKECSPQHAMGPCMVSAEGACGIWFTEN